MLRWLYIQLLCAHPAAFRARFGEEMLEAFDLTHRPGERRELLVDGLLSFFRQWVLRSEFRRPWQTATASGPEYNPLKFEQIEPYKPHRLALFHGGLMAILLLVGVVNAINQGGSKFRNFVIGMHRPGYGLIKVNRVEGGPLDTTIEDWHDPDDPWAPFARSYFRIVRVLLTLDGDNNLAITLPEMSAAPAALLRLDLNHDGRLSAEECGFLPGESGATAKLLSASRRDFMSENPVLAALDSDHDGELSAAEIAHSTVALQALDFNHDGKLMPNELLPIPALPQAAALMTRFDTNDDGVISRQEPPKEEAAAMEALLTAADRNHDSMVTRGELIVELAVRHAAPRLGKP